MRAREYVFDYCLWIVEAAMRTEGWKGGREEMGMG